MRPRSRERRQAREMKKSPFLSPKGIAPGSIDKAALAIGPAQRIRDPKWLASAKDRPCEACGSWEGVVAAHFNTACNSGMAQKAGDDQTAFLCFRCHMEADQSPTRLEWWALKIMPGLLAYRHRRETDGR